MAAGFSAVFVLALIVNVSATLWSSFRKIFVDNRVCKDGAAGDDENNEARKLLEDERQKRAEITKNYLPVYLLAVFSDWVKGPYAYEVYDCYNYNSREVYWLCSVLPFASSIVFGTFVCGPIADNGIDLRCGGGRKQMAMAFALVTIISNVVKHCRNFKASVVGSVLDGVSTSLLFTAFDSWLVRSYRCNGAKISSTSSVSQASLLQLSRALATAEYRNNIVAIGAGWMAATVAEMNDVGPLVETNNELELSTGGDNDFFYVGGVLNPFDLSSVALLVCAISMHFLWNENYQIENGRQNGPSSHQSHGTPEVDSSTWWQRHRSSVAEAFATITNNKEQLYTGLVCSLFESAMFIFVFTWSNAISSRMEGQQEIPYSLSFATFMLGCMTGTCVYTVLITELKIKNEKIGKGSLFAATFTFLGMILAKSIFTSMVAFLLFELLVGVYFPMMGTMKAEIVTEKHRGTIYNFYRIPFNAMMIAFFYWSGDPSSYLSLYADLSFAICACMVGTAFLLQTKLCRCREAKTLNCPAKQSQEILRDEAPLQKKMS